VGAPMMGTIRLRCNYALLGTRSPLGEGLRFHMLNDEALRYGRNYTEGRGNGWLTTHNWKSGDRCSTEEK
jgi:hypothetical protein